jgi:hypothetical protein
MDYHTGLAAIIHDLRRHGPRTQRLFVVVDLGDLHRGGRVGRLLGPGYADGLVAAARDIAQREIGAEFPIFPFDQDCFSFWLPDDGGTGWQSKIQSVIGKLREPLDCGGLPGAIVPSVGLARFIPNETNGEEVVLAALSPPRMREPATRPGCCMIRGPRGSKTGSKRCCPGCARRWRQRTN